jgi:hypothetical protein
MYKNAMIKDNQITKNMIRKQKITDKSNFHTPLELCLRLQYRSNRKQISKTDFTVQKPVDRIFEEDNDLDRRVGKKSIEVNITPAKIIKKPTVNCSFDSNYKIISYNFQKSFFAHHDGKFFVVDLMVEIERTLDPRSQMKIQNDDSQSKSTIKHAEAVNESINSQSLIELKRAAVLVNQNIENSDLLTTKDDHISSARKYKVRPSTANRSKENRLYDNWTINNSKR